MEKAKRYLVRTTLSHVPVGVFNTHDEAEAHIRELQYIADSLGQSFDKRQLQIIPFTKEILDK